MADSTLTTHDKRLAESAQLINVLTKKRIPFQFPPRITSETKSTNWQEKNQRSFEPVKVYDGSTARAITLEFEYIATGSDEFSAQKIARYLRELKEYYYKAVVSGPEEKQYPTFQVGIYDIVPSSITKAHFRLHNLTINYSSEIISFSAERSLVSFPLHTSVTLGLELVTNLSFEGTEPKEKVSPLEAMKPEWF